MFDLTERDMSTLAACLMQHLFRLKVCLRVSLSQQQQGHKMGLPRLLLSCVLVILMVEHTHSSVTQNCTCKTLWRQNELTPFPQIILLTFELSFTKSTQKKSKKYSPSSFPPDPPFLPPPPLLWLNYPGNKKGMLDWRETSYSHPYHKVQREFYDVHALLLVECSLFSLLKQFTHAFYLSCL